MKLNHLISILTILLLFGCSKPNLDVLNLNSNPSALEVFGNGLISTGLYERDIAISPDGKEIIYTLGNYNQTIRHLVVIKKENIVWSTPKVLNISGKYQDIEPFYSNNGNRLFFASNRPPNEGSKRSDYNIWYSNKENDKWGLPILLNDKVNTEKDEFYPSVSNNGNLYFTATRENGIGREDIYISKYVDGSYSAPVVLDSTINTENFEFNAYITPDENTLIFSSFGRKDGYGGGDLYFSKKDEKGKWMKAKNMGKKINSNKLDYCPFIDITRNNFYFTSDRVLTEGDLTTNTIEELTLKANQVQNGMGDIYRVSMDQLELD